MKRGPIILFALMLAIIYFPVFLHLSYLPFRMWDESILGVNAIQMMHNHNYLVTYFYSYPDMGRCKPPLALWCILLNSKILGFSELSLRLHSALAAAALCIYLFFVLKKITGNWLFGFFTVLILVTCQGYIMLHVTRTGEYDSLWILFSTMFALQFYMAVEAEDKKTQSLNLLLFFVFLTLGLLSKGIGCMLQLLPGIFIYATLRKKWVSFLKDKAFYGGLAFFLVFGVGYYFLREAATPGYLKAVWNMEIGTRFLGLSQGQGGPPLYYVKRLLNLQFTNYVFIFLPALYIGLVLADRRIKQLTLFSVAAAISFFVLVTIGAKKEPHYIAPIFPFLAIITASFFYMLYIFIKEKLIERKIQLVTASVISFLFVLALFGKPYYDVFKTVYFPVDKWETDFTTSSRFFQHVAWGQQDIKPYKLVYDTPPGNWYNTVLTCYKEELAEKNIDLSFVTPAQLIPHDQVVVFDSLDKQKIAHNFNTDTIQHLDYCNADILYLKGVK